MDGGSNHTQKENFYKNTVSKVFDTENCKWKVVAAKAPFTEINIITYHIYESDRRIEKHIPKNENNKYKDEVWLHPKNNNIDADESFRYYNSNGKLDYIIVIGKKQKQDIMLAKLKMKLLSNYLI